MSSLLNFIWEQRSNRRYLFAAVLICVSLIAAFKLFYPYPNMGLDSYFYVQAAAVNANVALWPIGYSKFLRALILPFHSTVVLVWVQYLLLEFACCLLFFTVLYFWNLNNLLKAFFFIFLFINPLFLYTSNFILSDSLFLTLSIMWITVLLWIIRSQKANMIALHAVLLLITFTVRNNALFYPIIATLAFLLSSLNLWKKIAGILLQVILIGLFMEYTSTQMSEHTGEKVFTPFTGWKIANNALYMYGHEYQNDTNSVSNRFINLDQVVRSYFGSVKTVDDLLDYNAYAGGSYYMFKYNSPLIHYMDVKSNSTAHFLDLKYSAHISSFYSDYGQYLIKRYPFSFFRYFILPNAIRYTYPPMEVFSSPGSFYLRDDSLGDLAHKWLGINTLTVSRDLMNLRTIILSPVPLFVLLTHSLFLLGLFGYLIFKGFRYSDRFLNKCILLILTYSFIEFCFSITTAAMNLRYLLFILVIKFTFSLIFIDYIYNYRLDKN